LGGEGENILLLKGSQLPAGGVLDDALPPYDDSCPANGGWSESPQGWLLTLEPVTLDGVDAWIENVAARLSELGINGILTGARIAPRPKWAIAMDPMLPRWAASMFFRIEPGAYWLGGWSGPDAELSAVVDHGVRWLAQHGSQLVVNFDGAQMAFGAQSASSVARSHLKKFGALVTAYQRERHEVRTFEGQAPNVVSLSASSDLLDPRVGAFDLIETLKRPGLGGGS